MATDLESGQIVFGGRIHPSPPQLVSKKVVMFAAVSGVFTKSIW
jgi:hypothetical protein